jgi:glycosyltransferase involved in cell wall biosynthesis
MPMRPVVLLAQTPPPFHGQAIMTQVLREALEGEFEVYPVRMDFSGTSAENKKLRFSKVWKLFPILFRTLFLLIRHRGAVLYYPPAPGHWVPVLRDLILLSVCRPFAGKTVFHFHARGIGDFLTEHRHLIRWPWMSPDYAIVLGPSVRRDAELLRAAHIVEIPYGVDVLSHEQAERSGAARPRILFAGFHTESKGIFDLLETARLLRERGLEFEMQTAGEWASEETRRRFGTLRAEYGLERQVFNSGLLRGDRLQAAYASADIFFFPTFYGHETFGVVLIEAMAHGLPVVASRWPGPMDVVCDGETGILCPVRDIRAYADALQRLMEDGELRQKTGRSAKEQYGMKYTRRQYEKSLRIVFQTICKEAA